MKSQVVLAVLGAAFLIGGIVRFVYLHAFSMTDAIHVCIAIPLALVALMVWDYVRQHGGFSFVVVAVIVIVLAATGPASLIGLGVALLVMAVLQWRSAQQ